MNDVCGKRYRKFFSSGRQLLTCGIVLISLHALAAFAGAQSYKVLYSFTGGADGGGPSAPLLRYNGDFYGTTGSGGASNHGTLFKITPQGEETVLHSFTGEDGSGPSGLARDSSGNFFGFAATGGPAGVCNLPFERNGCGVAFEFTSAGELNVLYAFDGTGGANPGPKPVLDAMGNLYGTASSGGSNPNCLGNIYQNGCGTVFKLVAAGNAWNEAVLYNFGGGADSFSPDGVIRRQGKLFGVTNAGNGLPCDQGICGTVFELTPSKAGWTKTTLHAFAGGSDGAIPEDDLVADSNGNFYGVTLYGGASGFGTIFRINSARQKTILYSFKGTDGAYPWASLTRDAAGNLYGTTFQGGTAKVGTVFKLDPANHLTVLHNFTGGTDGANPSSGLTLAGSFLYGTTVAGGQSNWGTVFKVAK